MSIVVSFVLSMKGVLAIVFALAALASGCGTSNDTQSFTEWYERINPPCAAWCTQCADHFSNGYTHEGCLRAHWWSSETPKWCAEKQENILVDDSEDRWESYCLVEEVAERPWE